MGNLRMKMNRWLTELPSDWKAKARSGIGRAGAQTGDLLPISAMYMYPLIVYVILQGSLRQFPRCASDLICTLERAGPATPGCDAYRTDGISWMRDRHYTHYRRFRQLSELGELQGRGLTCTSAPALIRRFQLCASTFLPKPLRWPVLSATAANGQ